MCPRTSSKTRAGKATSFLVHRNVRTNLERTLGFGSRHVNLAIWVYGSILQTKKGGCVIVTHVLSWILKGAYGSEAPMRSRLRNPITACIRGHIRGYI